MSEAQRVRRGNPAHRLVPLQAGTFIVTVHTDLLGHEFRRVNRCQVGGECEPRTDGRDGCLCDQQADEREAGRS